MQTKTTTPDRFSQSAFSTFVPGAQVMFRHGGKESISSRVGRRELLKCLVKTETILCIFSMYLVKYFCRSVIFSIRQLKLKFVADRTVQTFCFSGETVSDSKKSCVKRHTHDRKWLHFKIEDFEAKTTSNRCS